jgi:MoaA/NifB/PqqE/SkfB family radical SAM enzyme
MIINDKGIVHLCCADWKCRHILGDLKRESIKDIWNGERLREYQIRHLSMRKDEIDICVKCESLSANTTDDIDRYAGDILKRIKV